MPSDGDSFLPRIQSVFYAVFDTRHGPKIVYQVPEGLIAVPSAGISATSVPSTPSVEISPPFPTIKSRNSSISILSPTAERQNSRSVQSPHQRSSSSTRVLFNFDDISKYVIPHSSLCNKLVQCSTRRHRIIGFPVELQGPYSRNYFHFNVCFVFERTADLSCYEPIVRKISRVLTACEQESRFLSSPETSPALHGILEQLYEDLNSYSESSIRIDSFNSIELKIFPFYPNPPSVQDWEVPVALINLAKRIEDNWDLTMAKVCRFIDGVNHVSRIAHLADCDITLTRQAISHLLYYQVIMTIDVFQYSNMYTLRKSIQWLADQAHVKEECGPYVTKPGAIIPPWPQLLHLYSRLKSGKTVWEWMNEYGVHEQGIDVRRFTSFGVIKGFLRRVHRWPYLSQWAPDSAVPIITTARPRINSVTDRYSIRTPISPADALAAQSGMQGNPIPAATIATPTVSPDLATSGPSTSVSPTRLRRTSAAAMVLKQVRTRDLQNIVSGASPRTSWIQYPTGSSHSPTVTTPGIIATASTPQESPTNTIGISDGKRHSLVPAPSLTHVPPNSPNIAPAVLPTRPRLSRSPSAPVIRNELPEPLLVVPAFPPELPTLLDGEHHTDELCVRFEIGWPVLQQWLISAGDGSSSGESDVNYGNVSLSYR